MVWQINSGKSQILLSGNDSVSANIEDNAIVSKMKNELSFEDHINNFCKKAGQILNALARVAPYMCLEKKENNYESVRHISVLVLPFSSDVSWQRSYQ